MTREELKKIVFKTHSPLTVEEVMFGIDKYVEQIRAEVSESVLAIANAVIEGVRKEFERSNDRVYLGVICELQRFRSMIEKQLKENK